MQVAVHVEKSKSGESFRVFCPDLPGCSATAKTADAALDVLRVRITDYFARGASDPIPAGVRRTVIDV